MKLYLVRHTRVDTPAGICYGNSDVGLANTFPKELFAVQSKLEGIRFAKIYSSPLKRCVTLAQNLSRSVIIDERIREFDFGEWEHKAWNDIYALETGKKWFNDYVNTSCPQGESFRMMLRRVNEFLSRQLPDTDENILIVTHAGIIRAFLILIEDYTINEAFDTPVAYGEVITIEKKKRDTTK